MKKASSVTNLIGVIFLIVGLSFVCAAVLTMISDSNFRKEAESTMAIITDIETERYRSNGKTRTDHDVYVKYTVDGKTYEKLLNYYTSSMSVGDEVEVFYRPEAPGEIRGEGASIIFIVFAIIGLVFAAIGGSFVAVNVKNAKKRKKLLESGERVTGTIIDIETVTNVRINGRNPYKAVVEVVDYITGEKYLYSSEQVLKDLTYMVGSSVDVYVEQNDKSKYYVDLSSVNAEEYTGTKVHDFR